jgi:TonB-dependent starch-binding outer membrane protein SusC
MKLVTFILAFIYTGNIFCQNVTISERNVTIKKILVEITNQTGFYFGFTNGNIPKDSRYTLIVRNVPLKEALDILFKDKPFTYVLVNNTILITSRKINNKHSIPVLTALNGKVENEFGDPIKGATISIGVKGTITDASGEFSLTGFNKDCILEISSIGYETQKLVINNKSEINVKLKLAAQGLDEVITIGYGKTSRRLNTFSVNKIMGSEIIDQPVSNFAAALTGRVPGMLISQVNGIPGAAYKTQIQGRSSIGPTSLEDPEINVLYIVDGTPFALNNNNLPTIASGSTLDEGRSSFDLINTNDIENIEVLKDADATAIYGSRGANGVVLITTKKGVKGKPSYHINVNTGFGRITRYPAMMNTDQYVNMRRSAILNDGNTPNMSNAPDLFKWDTTRYTDFKKILIGGTSKTTNAYFSINGGQKLISYFVSGSYRKQTMVFPGNFGENTFYSHGNLQYKSADNKVTAALNFIATHDDNLSPSRDMTTYVNLPPNAPDFYDSIGGLVWQHNGYTFNNPMAALQQPYEAFTNNTLLNFNTSYYVTKGLAFKINAGLNNISIKESLLKPRKTFNTFSDPNAKATSYFAKTGLKSWILEPQVEFNSQLGQGKFSILIGSTYQSLISRITNHTANFSNDSVINDLNKATTVTNVITNSDYKYLGTFGRITLNWLDKYILNLTGRRDGSSRFGAGKQFGNFGALGAAWIFTKEPFIYKMLPSLSFGKIRTSYGITGSDQIGDYQYLDQWEQLPNTYQGITGIYPVGPANSYYSWQTTKKLALGIELGVFKDKLTLTADYYRNRAGDQIICVSLPGTTGFDRLLTGNYPAVVQNSGLEFTMQLNSFKEKDYGLISKLVLTIPKNKLLSFPNFSNSQYANRDLHVGHSLYTNSGLTYNGIDKNTGLFTFKDLDQNGTISYPNDYSIVVDRAPKYYGSLLNNFRFKNIEFECLFEMKNQISYNLLYAIYRNKPPGGRFNQPTILNDYWQKAGDQTYIQKLTANTSTEAYAAMQNFLSSNAVFSNASYLKIKYAALSYRLPERVLRKAHLTLCRIYVASNNLATITGFKAIDSELNNTSTLPPLRNLSVGFNIGF